MFPRRPGSIAVRLLIAALAALGSCGCASLPGAPPRLAPSTLGCIRATVTAKVPERLGDTLQHCLAAGMIARYCSVGEARLASWGKEAADALGRGNAERRDLDADRAGIRCARTARDDAGLRACCEGRYPEPAAAAAP